MARAYNKIEAASTQKFFFRKYMAPPDAVEILLCSLLNVSRKYAVHIYILCLLFPNSCGTIELRLIHHRMYKFEFKGKQSHFPGLILLMYAYLDYIKCDSETYTRVEQYLTFIQKSAQPKTFFCPILINCCVLFHLLAGGREES